MSIAIISSCSVTTSETPKATLTVKIATFPALLSKVEVEGISYKVMIVNLPIQGRQDFPHTCMSRAIPSHALLSTSPLNVERPFRDIISTEHP